MSIGFRFFLQEGSKVVLDFHDRGGRTKPFHIESTFGQRIAL